MIFDALEGLLTKRLAVAGLVLYLVLAQASDGACSLRKRV